MKMARGDRVSRLGRADTLRLCLERRGLSQDIINIVLNHVVPMWLPQAPPLLLGALFHDVLNREFECGCKTKHGGRISNVKYRHNHLFINIHPSSEGQHFWQPSLVGIWYCCYMTHTCKKLEGVLEVCNTTSIPLNHNTRLKYSIENSLSIYKKGYVCVH